MNAHRYFLYLATIVLGFLWYDAVRAFFFEARRLAELGVGLGSLVLLANVVLLSLFTFGCNSLRHLVGGKLDCFTCSRRRAHAPQALARRRPCSTAGTWSGRGSASLRSRSPTSTSASPRPASSTTRGSSEPWRSRRHDYDVVVIGAGGAGLRAAIAAAGARRAAPRSSASRCSARRTR